MGEQDAATGSLLDSTPLTWTKYESPPITVPGFYNGSAYVLTWATSTGTFQIKAARIRASDGVALDPWDDFNERPGSRVVCDNCSPGAGPYNPSVYLLGTEAVTVWDAYYNSRVEGLRMDATTGTRTDGGITQAPFVVMSGTSMSYSMAYDTSGGLLADTNGLAPLSVGVNNQPVGGAWANLGQSVIAHHFPAVASNGTDFLALWVSTQTSGSSLYPIRASRIDRQTGAYLDKPSIQVGYYYSAVGTLPVVASDGTDYLVAWVESATGPIRYGRIYANGSVDLTSRSVAALAPTRLAVAYDGLRYVLAWYGSNGIQAVRLNATDLSTLDASPVTIASVGSLSTLSAAADTTPTPDLRTFLIGWGTTSSTGLSTRRFRAATGSAVSQQNITTSASVNDLHLTTNGTEFAAFWTESTTPRYVRAARIDSLAGAQIGSTVIA